jgi:hypothetical protein
VTDFTVVVDNELAPHGYGLYSLACQQGQAYRSNTRAESYPPSGDARFVLWRRRWQIGRYRRAAPARYPRLDYAVGGHC